MKRLTNFISSLCRNEVAILCGALTLLLAGGATIPASGQSPDGETVVSGKVTSKATKDPLAGVVIYIEGTSFNTTTDSEGNYSFSFVPKEGTQIKFYFLGMEDYSVAYTGQKTIVQNRLRVHVFIQRLLYQLLYILGTSLLKIL